MWSKVCQHANQSKFKPLTLHGIVCILKGHCHRVLAVFRSKL